MNTSIISAASQYPPHIERNRGGGGKIVVGAVVKYKVGELDEELREGFLRWMMRYLNGVFQVVSGSESFQYE